MGGKEGEESQAANTGITAKVLDELEERLVERIMQKMAPREGEGGPSGLTSGGGEWATGVESEREPAQVIDKCRWRAGGLSCASGDHVRVVPWPGTFQFVAGHKTFRSQWLPPGGGSNKA